MKTKGRDGARDGVIFRFLKNKIKGALFFWLFLPFLFPRTKEKSFQGLLFDLLCSALLVR